MTDDDWFSDLREQQEASAKPGPLGWPYSNANAKANNIIWRLCKGVAPQQIYDALDAEGLAIVEKTGNKS